MRVFYGPKTHLTESGTQPDLIKVWAGFFFVEDNSDNLDEKEISKESFKPVDDGGILGEVRRRPCWSLGQSPSSRKWGNTKLDFWKEIFTLTFGFSSSFTFKVSKFLSQKSFV